MKCCRANDCERHVFHAENERDGIVKELMAKRLPDANIVETNTYYQGGKWFTEMSVGDHMPGYDSLFVLTHFKGHTMGGFGGSNKNIGIGCADGRIGKKMIHTHEGEGQWSVSEEELMERITESTKATVDHFAPHIAYVNVLRNSRNNAAAVRIPHGGCFFTSRKTRTDTQGSASSCGLLR